MFDFGFSEMLIIGVVALVVLGPERLPTVARTAGEWVGKAQRFVAQVKSDIDREASLSELKKIQDEAKAIANDMKSSVEAAASDIEKDVNAVANDVKTAGDSIESAVEDAVAEAKPEPVKTASAEDIANVYGWGTPSGAQSAPGANGWGGGWSEPKTFSKRYHSGPSVDELASESDRLRRELGLKEAQMGGTAGRGRRLAPRARSNRPRIYR